jgi:hypothetical protein
MQVVCGKKDKKVLPNRRLRAEPVIENGLRICYNGTDFK